MGGWVGPLAGLDVLEARQIPSPYKESDLRFSELLEIYLIEKLPETCRVLVQN
jgi:hypothetical protein